MLRHALKLLLPSVALVGTSCTSPRPVTPPADRPGTRGVVVPLTKPVLAPLSQPAYSLSNFADQRLPATPAFAFVRRQTTLRNLRPAIDAAVADLFKDPDLGRYIAGPMTFVYAGMTGTLDEAFTLDIGFPVRPDFQPGEKVQVRTLPAMRCLSVDFEGSIRSIDKAYDKLIPTVQSRNLRRSGEVREIYYRWDGPQSDTNQVLVAVGVAD